MQWKLLPFLWGAFLAVLLPTMLKGAHIVGGEMTYECVGTGQYVVTMSVYRDCFSGGALFDNPARISIFRVNNATGQTTLLDTLAVTRGQIVRLDDIVNPCLTIPPNICVEGTTYSIGVLNLPVDPNVTYVIAYQRCCRNNTISNILDPGDSGSTYTVSIGPEAQASCNSSPVFQAFPPTVICSGFPLEFDHSATDADGDSLVYEFCNPLLGGGVFGTPQTGGDPTALNGVAPNPAAPPPYDPVAFLGPAYSAANPMAGDPQITIDPNTGLITGTPQILGQFVVGVCVREYRNGVLIGTVRRDFQFNVTVCQPNVNAAIQADEQIDDKSFALTVCGQNTVDLVNLSTEEQFIDTYEWTFFVESDTQSFDTRDVTVTFPDTGLYEGVLILNEGLICADTASVFIRIFPPLFSNFNFDYDTCEVGPVSYSNLSFSEGGPIVRYDWDFADGAISQEENPIHRFSGSGEWEVLLEIEDVNGCITDTAQIIPWYPLPTVLSAAPINARGCQPLTVTFDALSFPISPEYTTLWEFGDGNSSEDYAPTHQYEEVGLYDVSLRVISPIGCSDSALYEELIFVKPSPIAGFDFSPKTLSNFNSTVSFQDLSTDGEAWQYQMGNEATIYEREPVYTFQDTGLMRVMQIVARTNGCIDTAIQFLDIVPEIRYFLPNAFTPNQDNKNDDFLGVGYFVGIQQFRMTIWNRWGELIYEADDPNAGWNGRKDNTGDFAPQGVYVYLIEFLGPRGKPYSFKGYVTLLR